MHSILVTKFAPVPATSGGKKRSLAVLKTLLELGTVTLICFDEDETDRQAIDDLGVRFISIPWLPSKRKWAKGFVSTRSLMAGRFWSAELANEIKRSVSAEAPDVLCVEYSTLAPYFRELNVPTKVLDLHNVESHLTRRMATTHTGIKRVALTIESFLFRRVEAAGIRAADLTVVVSDSDRERLPASPEQMVVCPNGWDTGPALPVTPDPTAIFVALMGWGPNEDAAHFLAKEVWPRVRIAVPNAQLLLVGKKPSQKLKDAATDGVIVTGAVPDVRPFLAQARVALAPLRAGGGSRLKILEGLDAGRPVVATSVGAEGLENLIGHGIIIADSADDQAARIVELLLDQDQATEVGLIGNAAIAEMYSWQKTLRPLVNALNTKASSL